MVHLLHYTLAGSGTRLPAADQQSVVDFLLTLRLTVPQGLEIQEYLDDPEELSLIRSSPAGP